MSHERAKAAKVGIFTFVTGALLAVVLVVFGGVKFWKHKDRYYIDLQDSVMGLDEGTQVYFNGIHVGSVGKIELDPDEPSDVRIAIDVDRGTPIHTDTVAMINMAGITGLKVIDLRGGSSKTAMLPPESHVPAGTSGFDKLQKTAERLADETSQMVNRAKDLMDKTGKVIDDISQITDKETLGAIVVSTRETTQNLAKASNDIASMVSENRTALKGAFTSVSALLDENRLALKTTFASVGKTTDNANELAGELRNIIHANAGQISATMADIRQAARTIKDLAREVREKPSRLVFSDAAAERKLP